MGAGVTGVLPRAASMELLLSIEIELATIRHLAFLALVVRVMTLKRLLALVRPVCPFFVILFVICAIIQHHGWNGQPGAAVQEPVVTVFKDELESAVKWTNVLDKILITDIAHSPLAMVSLLVNIIIFQPCLIDFDCTVHLKGIKFTKYPVDTSIMSLHIGNLGNTLGMLGFAAAYPETYCASACSNLRTNQNDVTSCNSFIIDGLNCHFGFASLDVIHNVTVTGIGHIYLDFE